MMLCPLAHSIKSSILTQLQEIFGETTLSICIMSLSYKSFTHSTLLSEVHYWTASLTLTFHINAIRSAHILFCTAVS